VTARLRLAAATVLLLLAACGGGGGSPGTPVANPEVPPSPADCPALDDGVDLVPGAAEAPACDAAQSPITVAYAPGGSHLLDLHLPPDATGPVPTVIWIHGGGWAGGSRTDDAQARRLVCRGYAVASIDYRLSGTAEFPAQIHDVKAAIRFLRANAATYGLDASRFATFGSSAGGHLASLAATSGGVADLEDLSQGNADMSSTVQAGIAWFGPTDLSLMDTQLLAQSCPAADAIHGEATSAESRLVGCAVGDAACAAAVARANPVTYVGASTPPLYLLHGTEDCTVPMAQSALLKTAMNSAGRCATLRSVVGAGHGGPEWQTEPPQSAAADFLDTVLKP